MLSRTNAIIAVAGSLLGIGTLATGPFVSFRPNRIVSGETQSGLQALGWWGWLVLGLWLVGVLLVLPALMAFLERHGGASTAPGDVAGWRGRLRAVVARTTSVRGLAVVRGLLVGVTPALVLVRLGEAASTFAAEQGSAARTSFGWCFYLFVFALYLVLYAASADTVGRAGRALVWVVPVLAVVVPTGLGALNELGLIREWSLTRSTFMRELTRHLFYASGATIGATVIGIPLGILAARRKRAETIVMGILNLGQVLPVLAFVGIMIPIMGGLSNRVGLLKTLGVSGIGWAPVMFVLLVYALFPVTRNTLAAIRQLDPAVLDTARGMGMGRMRTLWEIELPLAFPVVLAGIRVALVQSTAGAIIGAFVGGGGLGTIMFLGLEQTSMDLVLVGVVPIVVLALVFDAILRGVEHVVSRGQGTRPAASAT